MRIICALLFFGVMKLDAQENNDQLDYTLWEKDFETLVSHLSQGYTSPRIKPYAGNQAYWVWRDGYLAHASDQIRAHFFAKLESGISGTKSGGVAMSAIEVLSEIKNLSKKDIEKVGNIAVDLDKMSSDNGIVRNGALVAYLETFMPRQPVPNREELAIRALKSPVFDVRKAAAYALSEFGGSNAARALREYIVTNVDAKRADGSMSEFEFAAKRAGERATVRVPRVDNRGTDVSRVSDTKIKPEIKSWLVWIAVSVAAIIGAVWVLLRKKK